MIKANFELWKDIKGFEGLYQVSTLGRVRSMDRWVTYKNGVKRFFEGKIINTFISNNGYIRVQLNKNCKKIKYSVHRLVAETFIPNPDNLPCVNHKDEVKTNNYPYNLEWCTIEYNINYGSHSKKVGRSHWKKVYQYDLNNVLVNEWDSLTEASNYGFRVSNISSCCLGFQKTHKGFIWSYEELS